MQRIDETRAGRAGRAAGRGLDRLLLRVRDRVPGVRAGVALLVALAAFPLLGLTGIIPSYQFVVHELMVVLMWVALASSWNILGGFAGYVSLGHSVFFGIGGYLSGMLFVHQGLSPFLTAVLAGVAAFGFGFVVGLITLRVRGPSFIISTIALLVMMRLVFENWEYIGGANGLTLPLTGLGNVPFYYAMLAAAAGSVVLAYRVRSSKFGLGLRAIAQDETKAETAGINTWVYKSVAFGLSGFFIAVAGAVWGYSLGYLRPTAFLTIAIAADMALMTIIGGKGTVSGPVVGAVLLVVIDQFSIQQFGSSALNLVVTGVLLVLAIVFFPEGIVGALSDRLRGRDQDRIPPEQEEPRPPRTEVPAKS